MYSVQSATQRDVSEWDVITSLDPNNEVCSICRGNAFELKDDVCPCCLDDMLMLATGCRFGEPDTCTPYSHVDCPM